MIKSVFLISFLSVPMFLSAANCEDPDYPTIVDKAKSERKDIVVFYDGSNWSKAAAITAKAYAETKNRSILGNQVIWSCIDQKELTSEENKALKASKSPKAISPGFDVWNIPAILLVDPDGRVYSAYEGVKSEQIATILSDFKTQIEKRIKRDELWKKADSASGVEKATLLGQGLDLMPFNMAKRNKKVIDEIKKVDKDDNSGYILKFTYDAPGFLRGTLGDLMNKKKFDEAFALTDKHLSNPHLTIFQRQTVHAGRAQIYKRQRKMDDAIREWNKIISLDPNSDMAKGAKNYMDAHLLPVRLPTLSWDQWDNTPEFLPWIVDVSSKITQDGTYEIEFKHKAGQTEISKVVIKQKNQEIVVNENPKKHRKVTIKVSGMQSGSPVEMWVTTRGTGWYDGRGDIIITPVP